MFDWITIGVVLGGVLPFREKGSTKANEGRCVYHSHKFDLTCFLEDNNIRIMLLHEVVKGLPLAIDLSTVQLPQTESRGVSV